jgi:hypothetical protein
MIGSTVLLSLFCISECWSRLIPSRFQLCCPGQSHYHPRCRPSNQKQISLCSEFSYEKGTSASMKGTVTATSCADDAGALIAGTDGALILNDYCLLCQLKSISTGKSD